MPTDFSHFHPPTFPYITVRGRDSQYQIPYRAPLRPPVRIARQLYKQYHLQSAMTTTTMPNYMILHASAYPPLHWSFLANRQSQNSRASNIKHKNELWTKMTNHYEQSMTERQHHVDSNALSKTATADNISKMRPNVKELYRPLPPTNFEDAARVKVWRSKERFFEKMDKLAGNLKKIPEDKTGTTELPQRLTEREWRRDKQAISNAKVHRDLLDDEDANIEIPFRKRLDVIYDVHYNFICSSRSNRPRWAQLCRMHREVTDHVARVTYAKEQLKSDVTLMSTFLREQLFDQYCLMRDTPMEKKDETWLQCGKFLNLGMEIGMRENDIETKGERPLTF